MLPTPAVALLAEGLAAVVTASHNPPEYNGVKLFASRGRKLGDDEEEEIEALLDTPADDGGSIERLDGAAERYLAHVLEHFGSDLSGLRIGVDCANGAFPRSRRARSRPSAPRCTRSASSPTARTSTSAAARPTSRL